MSAPFPRSVAAICLLAAARMQAQVVVNEIMYRPGTAYPEDPQLEFIELHNPTAAAVDLSGWAITTGVDYTFAAGASLAAGGYVVVASDPTVVQAAYGISGVFGPWAAGTGLANSGEKITLSKPGVVAGTFDKIDSVTYASEGDWGTRVIEGNFGGWEWTTLANGGNKSIELRNPAISNDNGQNWSPSTAAAGATPGAVNSTRTTNVRPIIHDVKHSPAVPKSTQLVTISCEVTDESASELLAATLFWRVGSGSFQSKPMALDPLTGKFATTLGPHTNLAIVEFYVSVSDGVNTRTWPAATGTGQTANCQYQVTNETLNANDAYYWLVLTGAENTAYNNTATTNPNSDRQFNTTLIVTTGSDTTIRYRSAMRIRGNSSRQYTFKPLRIAMPNDDPWDGRTNFNLNPRASFLQFLGMRLVQAAGVRAPDSIPVKPRRNGVEYTTTAAPTPDYGRWVREEDVNSDMVDAHWPEAKGGGIYKKGRPDWYWRGGIAPPANPNGTIDGWLKQSNSGANDWTDLTGFFSTVQAVTAPHFPGAATNNSASASGNSSTGAGLWNGTAFTTAEITTLDTVADLDQWARWFAVMTLLQDFETNLSNGQDDDYGVYFAPNALGQRRANFVTHDLDTILGLGEANNAFNAAGLFDMTDSSFVFRPLLPLLGNNATPGNAAFRQQYFDALREMLGTVFDADTAANANPPFHQFVDSHLTGWVPAATIQSIKDFMRLRRAYLLDLIPDGVLGGAVATALVPPAATATATATSAHGALMISEILANNAAALNVGGTFPDAIELRNLGGTPIDLSGMSLTDDPAAKTKFVFPAGTIIPGNGYLIVYADSSGGAGLHTGFALDQDGDSIRLYDTAAAGQALLDSVSFGLQPTDFTIGRTGALLDTWTLCTPTLGGANLAVATFAPPGILKINEWAGNADYRLDEDFLEVFNSAAQPVALGGMTLTDDYINYPGKFTLPPLSFAGPGAFLRFRAKGSSATAGNASELPFSIDADFGWLALIGQNGTIVDRVDIVAQPGDSSRGRTPNGTAAVTTFSVPTPGASNLTPPPNVLALIAGLRISELLYKPSNLEFIELHNIGATTLDLAGVRFVKGVTYTFPEGVTLAPGAYLVVCRDRAAFQARYGAAIALAPDVFSGTLDNAGETITLQPPAPWDVNILNFAYSSAWYPETNNDYSLTVIDDLATAARDWGDKGTWSPSPAAFGSPGVASPPFITSAGTVGAVIGDAFAYQIVATKSPTSYGATGLPAGLAVNATTGMIDGAPAELGTFNVTLSASNSGGTGTGALTLTVGASGPVSTLVWSAIANPQAAGISFAAALTASDAQGRTVTSFNGTASLTANVSGGAGTQLAITEANPNSPDFFEIQNVSGQIVNTAGWFVVLNDASSGNPNAVHGIALNLPATMSPGELLYRTDSDLDNWWGENIFWVNTSPGWVMVVDGSGAIRDFVAWNLSEAQIAGINFTKTVNATAYTLNPIAQGAWTGAGVAAGVDGTSSFLRIGGDDLGTAADWTYAAPSKGALNGGLTLPFPGGTVAIPMTPANALFVNGVWSGNVAIGATGSAVALNANDGSGHVGKSNSFDVTGPPAPVIMSPASALAVINGPFSYQILATNFAVSFTATNLPAGLAVNPTTGLISGTPTASGTATMTLGATNLGGTGTAALSLQIQTDADGDGMGDAWESANGLNATMNDSAADRDGDGQSNLAEWIAGTLPNNAASRFAITNTAIVGGDVVISWSAVAGRRYRVFERAALNSGAWSEITSAPIVATGVSATFPHTGGTAGARRFYRAGVER